METKCRQLRCEDWQQSFMACFLQTSLALIKILNVGKVLMDYGDILI